MSTPKSRMAEYYPDEYLPDGTNLAEITSCDGWIRIDKELHGWTGLSCKACNGTGECLSSERCGLCGGTGEEHGAVYLVEE